jgi:selenocysteine lyase/cysteine desulfurase
MRNETMELSTEYRSQFSDFEGVTYLNASAMAPMPLVAAQAAQEAIAMLQNRPQRLIEGAGWDYPDRIRERVARLIDARPDEIAVTTGASSGLASVAAGIDWKPGDEVLVGYREFPAHFSTWVRYQEAGRLRVRVIEPRGAFIDAEDYVAAIGPRTRVVSASLVRFDNGAMLDAARVAQACEKVGAAFVLDVSQCAGAMPLRARDLGASMIVCSGYKWLLGPYGVGFFWVAPEWVERLPLGAVYFMALQGARDHQSMFSREMRPAPGARRWDSPETANFMNLSAFEASLDLVARIGVPSVKHYIDGLINELIERLPPDRYRLASPEQRDRRGPYVCFVGRDAQATTAAFQKLREAQVIVSLREGAIRVSAHIYNTPADIARLLEILSA